MFRAIIFKQQLILIRKTHLDARPCQFFNDTNLKRFTIHVHCGMFNTKNHHILTLNMKNKGCYARRLHSFSFFLNYDNGRTFYRLSRIDLVIKVWLGWMARCLGECFTKKVKNLKDYPAKKSVQVPIGVWSGEKTAVRKNLSFKLREALATKLVRSFGLILHMPSLFEK